MQLRHVCSSAVGAAQLAQPDRRAERLARAAVVAARPRARCRAAGRPRPPRASARARARARARRGSIAIALVERAELRLARRPRGPSPARAGRCARRGSPPRRRGARSPTASAWLAGALQVAGDDEPLGRRLARQAVGGVGLGGDPAGGQRARAIALQRVDRRRCGARRRRAPGPRPRRGARRRPRAAPARPRRGRRPARRGARTARATAMRSAPRSPSGHSSSAWRPRRAASRWAWTVDARGDRRPAAPRARAALSRAASQWVGDLRAVVAARRPAPRRSGGGARAAAATARRRRSPRARAGCGTARGPARSRPAAPAASSSREPCSSATRGHEVEVDAGPATAATSAAAARPLGSSVMWTSTASRTVCGSGTSASRSRSIPSAASRSRSLGRSAAVSSSTKNGTPPRAVVQRARRARGDGRGAEHAAPTSAAVSPGVSGSSAQLVAARARGAGRGAGGAADASAGARPSGRRRRPAAAARASVGASAARNSSVASSDHCRSSSRIAAGPRGDDRGQGAAQRLEQRRPVVARPRLAELGQQQREVRSQRAAVGQPGRLEAHVAGRPRPLRPAARAPRAAAARARDAAPHRATAPRCSRRSAAPCGRWSPGGRARCCSTTCSPPTRRRSSSSRRSRRPCASCRCWSWPPTGPTISRGRIPCAGCATTSVATARCGAARRAARRRRDRRARRTACSASARRRALAATLHARTRRRAVLRRGADRGAASRRPARARSGRPRAGARRRRAAAGDDPRRGARPHQHAVRRGARRGRDRRRGRARRSTSTWWPRGGRGRARASSAAGRLCGDGAGTGRVPPSARARGDLRRHPVAAPPRAAPPPRPGAARARPGSGRGRHALARRPRDAARARGAAGGARRAAAVHAHRDAARLERQALDLWPEGERAADRLAASSATRATPSWRATSARRRGRSARSWPRAGPRARAARSPTPSGGSPASTRCRATARRALAARRVAAEAFAANGLPGEAAAERLVAAGYLQSAGQHTEAAELARRAGEEAVRAERADLRARAMGLEGVATRQARRLRRRHRAHPRGAVARARARAHAPRRRRSTSGWAPRTRCAATTAARARRWAPRSACANTRRRRPRAVCLSCMAYVLRELGDWDQVRELAEELITPRAARRHARRRRHPRLRAGLARPTRDAAPAAARALPGDRDPARRHLDAVRQRGVARLAGRGRGRRRARIRALPAAARAVGAQRGPPLRRLGPALGGGLFARTDALAEARACAEGAVGDRRRRRPPRRAGGAGPCARRDRAGRGRPRRRRPALGRAVELHEHLDIPFERAQILRRAGVALAAAGRARGRDSRT